ncbi:hypothetical protein PG996_009250 [Apiospora saccharicola]|uniref:Uncharacterized protein n=1 Tax=Apiospora saccharicola TaxID=335842 RepID=A0ABR1UK75_9PEZI
MASYLRKVDGYNIAVNDASDLNPDSNSSLRCKKQAEHEVEEKETQLEDLKLRRLETAAYLKELENKLARLKAERAEHKTIEEEAYLAWIRSEQASYGYNRDVLATEKIIVDTKGEADEQARRVSTLEQEIGSLRTRLLAVAQNTQPQASGIKRSLNRDSDRDHDRDQDHESRRKRLRMQEKEEGLELADPKFHTQEEWTRATFAKKNGIFFTYARVEEKARVMTAKVIGILESVICAIPPMPLQIRRVFRNSPRELADQTYKVPSGIRVLADKPYHVFFDSLAEGVQALQQDVEAMVTQLINLQHCFVSDAEPSADNVGELLKSLENTYMWHELNDFIGFDLEDKNHDKPDQLRLSVSRALRKGSNVSGQVEWYLSHLVEQISRFALVSTLLGGCLLECFGRGDFENADHGIKGLRLRDIAKIVEQHYNLERALFIENHLCAMRFRRSRWLGFGFYHVNLCSEKLDGAPRKILNKLVTHTKQPLDDIWDLLYGHQLAFERRSPMLLHGSGSESESDASYDSTDESSSDESSNTEDSSWENEDGAGN